MLAFYPMWVHLLFVGLSAFIFIPAFHERFLNGMSQVSGALDLLGSSRRSYTADALLVVAGGTAFVGLRSATHLLGDGYLGLRELPKAVTLGTGRFGNEPLALEMVRVLHRFGDPLWHSAEFTYRFYSYLFGILYLLISLAVARLLGRCRLEKIVVLGFLLTPGFMQVFCGYVENYPPIFPMILLYLWAGLLTLRGRLPLWTPAGILGLLIPLHFITVTLAPSLCLLAIFSALSAQGTLRASHKSLILKALPSFALVPAIVLIVFWVLDFNPFTYVKGLRGTHFFPVLSQPSSLQQYRLFSPAHLLDFFNQQLLIAPSALLVGCIFSRGRSGLSQEGYFLLTASLFPLLFTFLANPEIGAFRDWDVMSLPALPLTLCAAVALIHLSRGGREDLTRAGFLICGAVGIHSLVWIGLNAHARSAEARFTRILGRSPLSPHARAYAWETLGSYYKLQNETECAMNAYKQAAEATPENPRHWYSTGAMYFNMGQFQAAIDCYRKTVALNPNFQDGYFDIGDAFYKLGQYQEAVDSYRKAVALKPDFFKAYANMGNALGALGQHRAAIGCYQKAIALKPDFAEAYFNMGNSFNDLGQHQTAIGCYQKAIALKPDFAEAYSNMGNVFSGLGQHQTAIGCYQKAIALKPDFAEAYSNIGSEFYNLSQYQKAIDHYQKAVALKPDFVEVYSNMGVVYQNLNQPERVRECFKKVLDLNPHDSQAPAIRKWLQDNP